MKKPLFNSSTMRARRRALANALDGDGKIQAFKEELLALVEECENAEMEITAEDFAEMIKPALEKLTSKMTEEQNAAIAEHVAKRFAEMKNAMLPATDRLSVEVKNKIACAVLRSNGRGEVENNVNRVLVENGISGLTFNEVIDYSVADGWGDSNPVFKQLKKVVFSKWFYTTQDLTDGDVLAKGWVKTSESDKAIQALSLNGKTITPQYVYKRQSIAREDLVNIEQNASNLLQWINEELDRQIVNTIVQTILVGDLYNSNGQKVTSFEAIGAKTTTDAFTTLKVAAVAGQPSFVEVRQTVDLVKNPFMLKKVGFMSQSTLTSLAAFTYASGGKVIYRSKEEIAMQIGVDELIITDALANTGVNFVVMIPEEYWVLEREALSVSYPKYERNEVVYQKERLIGGAIHGLHSTAVLIDPEEPEIEVPEGEGNVNGGENL